MKAGQDPSALPPESDYGNSALGDNVGKKSRLKRERRAIAALLGNRGPSDSGEYLETRDLLQSLFSLYCPSDVYLALGVSELWMPNIASQVKHYFGLNVFSSMDAALFRAEKTINDYEAFTEFSKTLYELLPSFPSLEDYVPECDWGNVRSLQYEGFPRLFYGNSVERIPDFITAFTLQHGGNSAAVGDMHAALMLQDRIISRIDPSVIGASENTLPGQLDMPSEIGRAHV